VGWGSCSTNSSRPFSEYTPRPIYLSIGASLLRRCFCRQPKACLDDRRAPTFRRARGHRLARLRLERCGLLRRQRVDHRKHPEPPRTHAQRRAPRAHQHGHDERAQPRSRTWLPRARAPSGAPLRRRPRLCAGTARRSCQGRRRRPRSGSMSLDRSEHGATVGRRRRSCADGAGGAVTAGGCGDLRGRGCGRHVPMMPIRTHRAGARSYPVGLTELSRDDGPIVRCQAARPRTRLESRGARPP
jgi:hypothetical protein